MTDEGADVKKRAATWGRPYMLNIRSSYPVGAAPCGGPPPCHSEAVTDVTAVGIRNPRGSGLPRRKDGLPRQSADWLAMTQRRRAYWLAMTGRGVKYLLYSPRTPPELYEKIHILEITAGFCLAPAKYLWYPQRKVHVIVPFL